jgi:hypothetical protein
MLLSILVPGKNDNFRKSNSKVLKFNLEQTIHNIKDLGVDDVELVLCDWGSPKEKRIVDDIVKTKHINFKCVYVSPEIAQKYNGEWNYSIVHPINTAFRHSTGKYVIFWDSDCFHTLEDFKKLYEFVQNMDKTNDLKFYWGSRHHLPYSNYSNFDRPKELENYLINNLSNLKFNIEGTEMYNTGNIPGMEMGGFYGNGISMLMNRMLWESSTGWFEELPYWGFQDVEFHNRLLQRYKHGGDLAKFGINFYHLLPNDNHMDFNNDKHPNMKMNKHHGSEKFEANPPSWGLSNEMLEVI